MKSRAKRQRIRRLRNRISRTRARLEACDQINADEDRRTTLRDITKRCDSVGRDFEQVVDRVADYLDDLIEPRNPVWEWVSDVGIDIVAVAAVAVWRRTEDRLKDRLLRDTARLKRLQGDA